MRVRRRLWRELIVLVVLASTLFLSGCEMSGSVPSYVYMHEFELTTSTGEGSASESITEGWFYVNGEFLGAYSLPTAAPVIEEGNSEIVIFPGVRLNGIRTLPDLYPFYGRFEINVDLRPGQTDSIYPVTGYVPSARFRILEDFETTNVFRDDLDGDPFTAVEFSEDVVFEGLRSGEIRLTAEHPFIEVASLPVLERVPVNGSPVFVEIDHLNNVEFGIGLVGLSPGQPPFKQVILFLRKRDEWNKIYLELTETLIASQLPGYQLFITAVHDGENAESTIYLDNIKLIHPAQ